MELCRDFSYFANMRVTFRFSFKALGALFLALLSLFSVGASSASAIGTLSSFNFYNVGFRIDSISGSQDGRYVLAAGGAGYVRVSNNYGANWNSPSVVSSQGYYYFTTAGSSNDGRVMVLGGYRSTDSTGAVFVSVDFGVTWNPVVSNYNYGVNPSQSVTVSGDGLSIYTADKNYDRQMFKSTFISGAWTNWSKLANSPTARYSKVSTNFNGQVIIATTSLVGVSYSRDYGATWALSNSLDSMFQWLDPNATTSTGLGLAIDTSQAQLWRTANSGSSWSRVTTVPNVVGEKFWGVTSSNDGKRIYLSGSVNLYRSLDSGATWTTVDVGGEGANNANGAIFSAGSVVGNVVLYSEARADLELAIATFTVSLATQVQSLTGTAGNNQVALTWSAPSSNGDAPGITDYLVKYKASGDSTWTTFADGVKTTTGATVNGLNNGTTYTFNVIPVTIYGQGAENTSSSYTPATLPGAPTSVTGIFSEKSVLVMWVPPTNDGGSPITQYSVQYQVNGTGSFITFGGTAISTQRSLFVGGLTDGTSYKFKVAATNAMGSTFSGLTAAITPKKIPTFSWADSIKSYGDAGYTITAPTVTNSVAGTFTYTSATTSVATITSSGTIAILTPGSTVITATFTPTNTTINHGGGTVTTLLTVNKKVPTFSSFTEWTKTYGEDAFASTVSISNSILGSIVYTSSNTAVATIASNGTVTIVKAGTTVIQAAFTPTDGTKNAAGTASRTLTIEKKAQGAAQANFTASLLDYGKTFTFGAAVDAGFGITLDQSVSIPSGYSTGATPVYSVVSGNCSISGDKMTATSIGVCAVKGTIPGGENYLDSAATGSITVAKVLLDIEPATSSFTYGQTITPTYAITGLKGNDSVLSVTRTFTGVSPTVYGPSTTAPSAVGTYRVAYSNILLTDAKNLNYTVSYSNPSNIFLTIGKSNQSTLVLNQSVATALTSLELTTSGGSSAGTVTYKVLSGPCNLSASTLNPYSGGTCVVQASMAGSENYNIVYTTKTNIVVSKKVQNSFYINESKLGLKLFGSFTDLVLLGGSGGGAVSAQVVSGPCRVTGVQITPTSAGVCVVTATKASDVSYLEATSAPVVITFDKKSVNFVNAATVTKAYGENAAVASDFVLPSAGLVGADAIRASSVKYLADDNSQSNVAPTKIGTYQVFAVDVIFSTGSESNYIITTANPIAYLKIVKGVQGSLTLTTSTTTFGSTLNLSTTGGSGTGALTYSVASGNCTVAGNILSNSSPGKCYLDIFKGSDDNYDASNTFRFLVTVAKAPQAQLVLSPFSLSYKGLTLTSVAGGSTSELITISVLSGPCSVIGTGYIGGTSVGNCEISATRSGDDYYLEVNSNTVNITVTKAAQQITLLTFPTNSQTQKNIIITTDITSGLAPTITTSDSAICTASGSIIFTVATGACSFTISQSGDSLYLAATSINSSFGINSKADPAIGDFSDSIKNLNEAFSFLPSANYDSNPVIGTWVITSSDAAVLSISGMSATALKGGSVFVTATFTPELSSSFNTTSKVIKLSVLKGVQSALTITTNTVAYGSKSNISVSGGSSAGNVSFVVDSGNCSVTAGVLSSTSGGNCYITATMEGNQSYENVSSASSLVTVTKIAQDSLAITSLNMHYGTPLTLVATGGTGTGALNYVVDSGHCSVSGYTLTATDVDTSADSANDCYVIVTRATDASYTVNSAAKTKITISAGTQSALTITSITATYGASYSLTTSGGSSSGSVSYVVTSGDCTVSGSTLTNAGAGICSVTATMASSARYLAVSSVATEITIAKATQSALLISNNTTAGTYGGTIELTTSGGTTDGSVTYAVHSEHPCTISGSFLVPTAGGDCVVIATMSGGANYQNISSSEVTFSFAKNAATISSLTLNKNIGSTIQSLTYQVLGFVNGDAVASLTTNYEGDSVTYALSTTVPDVAGIYKIRPSAAKLSTGADASTKYDLTYLDGSLTVYIGVQAPLIITSTSIDVLNILDLTTSGGSGTGAVTYIVNAGSCYIGGPQLVPTSGYDCQVTATKAADSEYGAISSEKTLIRVIKIAQTLTFDAIADLPLDYVHAYANASSNRSRIVEYSSLTPAVCTSSSYLVDLISVGTCTLAANQSGDEFVGIAAQVTRSFQVTAPYVAPKSPQAPLYIYIPNSAGVVGDSVLVMPYGGTAGTPNELTIAAPNSNSCTLEAITDTQNYWLYAESAGTCRIVFNKMGDYLFDSATAVTADVVFTAPDISAFSVAIEIDTSVTPPSISADISTQTIDQYGTIATVTFTNSGGAVDSYSYLTVPPGLTFDPITGKLSGKMTNTSFAFAFGITATNAGGSSMASTVIAFTPIIQIVTFNQPFDMNLGYADQALTATSSSSATVSRFGSSTNAICTVFKGGVKAVAEGTCTLTADLPGDLNYADAQQVSVSFTIYPVGGPPAVAPIVTRPVTYAFGGGTGTLPTRPPVAEGIGFTVVSGVGLSRSGFTFKKWNDGTSDYSAGDIYTISTSDVVLTATWTANAPAPAPAPAPSSTVSSNPIANPAAIVSTPVAPIIPVVSSLVFTENATKDGGVLSWSGTNVQSWRFIGDEKIYPAPYVYGGYTVSWPGTLVNMVRGVSYNLTLEVLSTTGTGSTKTITYLLEGKTATEIAAEVAQKLAQETSVAEAKAIAEQKLAEEAAEKAAEEKAAAAKTLEDARIAAEAKATEDARLARIAAEAKAATDIKIAEEAALKISKEKSEAEAQAVKEAASAALAAKRLVLKFSINMPVVKAYLDTETKALIKNYALTLPANSNVTCIGYTYSSKPTKTEQTRAKDEALAACKYVVSIKKGTKYYIDVKSWLAITPKPKAMDTKKLHRLDISSSIPLTIEEIIEMSNLVALVRKDNDWVM